MRYLNNFLICLKKKVKIIRLVYNFIYSKNKIINKFLKNKIILLKKNKKINKINKICYEYLINTDTNFNNNILCDVNSLNLKKKIIINLIDYIYYFWYTLEKLNFYHYIVALTKKNKNNNLAFKSIAQKEEEIANKLNNYKNINNYDDEYENNYEKDENNNYKNINNYDEYENNYEKDENNYDEDENNYDEDENNYDEDEDEDEDEDIDYNVKANLNLNKKIKKVNKLKKFKKVEIDYIMAEQFIVEVNLKLEQRQTQAKYNNMFLVDTYPSVNYLDLDLHSVTIYKDMNDFKFELSYPEIKEEINSFLKKKQIKKIRELALLQFKNIVNNVNIIKKIKYLIKDTINYLINNEKVNILIDEILIKEIMFSLLNNYEDKFNILNEYFLIKWSKLIWNTNIKKKNKCIIKIKKRIKKKIKIFLKKKKLLKKKNKIINEKNLVIIFFNKYQKIKEFELNFTRLNLKKNILLNSKPSNIQYYLKNNKNIINNILINNLDLINIFEKNIMFFGYLLKKKKQYIIMSISKTLLTKFFIKYNIFVYKNKRYYIQSNTKLNNLNFSEIYNYYYMLYIKLFKYFYWIYDEVALINFIYIIIKKACYLTLKKKNKNKILTYNLFNKKFFFKKLKKYKNKINMKIVHNKYINEHNFLYDELSYLLNGKKKSY